MVETDPRTRVVLLGASNLTLAFPLVLARLRAILPGPLEVLAAIGHGRSYGKPSRVLFRELPGIAECGLWRALEAGRERAGGETLALFADFGNDIVYGSPVDEVAGWIERDLDLLASLGARSALVRLPIDSVESLSPLRFRLARRLIFPSHRIDLPTVRERVRALDERLVGLARERGAALVAQEGSWYGLDPIHILRSRRGEAWERILSSFGAPRAAGDPAPCLRLSRGDRALLRRSAPEWRRWMGREESRGQPSAKLLDGTTIALY